VEGAGDHRSMGRRAEQASFGGGAWIRQGLGKGGGQGRVQGWRTEQSMGWRTEQAGFGTKEVQAGSGGWRAEQAGCGGGGGTGKIMGLRGVQAGFVGRGDKSGFRAVLHASGFSL
jgi:hypothetical protein